MKNKYLQMIKFLCVGLSNNLIFYLIYIMALNIKLYYLIANIIAYFISSIWGFWLNGRWVFHSTPVHVYKKVARYYVVYISSFLINIVLLFLFVDKLFICKTIAPLLVLCFTIPFNYILCKFWVYRGEQDENNAK